MMRNRKRKPIEKTKIQNIEKEKMLNKEKEEDEEE